MKNARPSEESRAPTGEDLDDLILAVRADLRQTRALACEVAASARFLRELIANYPTVLRAPAEATQ